MKFNDTKQTRAEKTESTNKAGGLSYDPATPEMALYKVTVNQMLEDTYYVEDEQALSQVKQAFNVCAETGNQEFVLELAAYARNEMGNRDIAVLLYVLAANDDRFTPEDPAEAVGVRDYGPRILRRMDEPMTALAMHDHIEGGTAPKALKKGISDAIAAMLGDDYDTGAYRLQKYTQSNREINIWDAVNRSHVRAYAGVEEETHRDELMTQLMEGPLTDHPASPLPAAKTWEEVISDRGSDDPDAWRDALEGNVDGTSRGMGLMARVMNIRNMLEAGVSGDEIFGDDEMERVKHSRMFPFRFYTAYQAYQNEPGINDRHVESFLEDAIQELVSNVPDTWGDTAVGIDLSGSMNSPVSNRSVTEMSDLSSFFGGICMNKGAYAAGFGKNMQVVDSVHHQTPALEIAKRIKNFQRNEINTGGTNAWKFLQHLDSLDRSFDRIVFFTDMQAWDNHRFSGAGRFNSNSEEQTVKEWIDQYRKTHGPTAVYCVDLASYGDLMTPENYQNVYNISGWNEKVLEFPEYAEEPGQIIGEIR